MAGYTMLWEDMLDEQFCQYGGIDGDQRELIFKQGWQQMEITSPRDVSQLCTKQVGTGEIIK